MILKKPQKKKKIYINFVSINLLDKDSCCTFDFQLQCFNQNNKDQDSTLNNSWNIDDASSLISGIFCLFQQNNTFWKYIKAFKAPKSVKKINVKIN